MRLICPNCGAQYEVDDSLIPDGGRDVQCSNCGHAWFQRPAHLDTELADELEVEPAPEDEVEDERPAAEPARPEHRAAADETDAEAGEDPADAEPEDSGFEEPAPPLPGPRPTMDDSVRQVLAEEAEREARARRQEAAIETQGELGLEASPKSSGGLRDRVARMRGMDAADEAAETSAAATATAASRRDRLPDIDEINSTLRSAEERDQEALAEPAEPPRRGGFGTGFTLVVILALLAVLVYAFADRIATALPATAPALDAYVHWADGLRAWLDGVAQDWVRRIGGMMHSAHTDAPAG
jgi:predicted Zn finger-like uncharacterized protein